MTQTPPVSRRATRRLAMQWLYLVDLQRPADAEHARAALDQAREDRDEPAAILDAAADLALAAWHAHHDADQRTEAASPEWPARRQPPVDRAILRLAIHEIVSGRTPRVVAINEAIELAKRFGAEGSPAFINAVLDRVTRQMPTTTSPEDDPADATDATARTPEETADDPWLADAVRKADEPGLH